MHPSDDNTLPLRRFPARIAQLGFAVQLPADWISHPLPDEVPDFADPSRLVPLAAVTAPHAAIVWAAAARPAYGDGTLSDWARYLVAQHGLALRSVAEGRLGTLAALIGEAEQASEIGPLRIRFAFAEDGGRLINLTLTAPEMLADAVTALWFAGIGSFTLDEPRGATVPLWPPSGLPQVDEDPGPTATLPGAAGATANGLAGLDAEHTDAAEITLLGAEPPSAGAQADDQRTLPPPAAADHHAFAAHARAQGAATLEPEHAINRRLRDNGVGLVPRVVEVDEALACATVACGAVTAQLTLPLGWHVIDDGRRVLVFEPAGEVQVHLDLLPQDETGLNGVLDALEAQARRDYPAPEFLRLRSGPMLALGVRHIADGDQPLEQYHLLVDGPDAGHVLRARVTATPATASAAANLGELILRSAVFGSFVMPAQAADHGPDWWMAALLMERADRLQEAEQCITDAVDHIGAAIQVAELYRQRMLRLQNDGRPGDALKARDAAIRWAHHYASCATSGGEGAALSRERDAFIAQL